MLVLDVDGTLTDGKIYMGENGEVMKAFNCHDTLPLRELAARGIITIIMTSRTSKIVENRAKEMHISEVYQNIVNKKEKLDQLIQIKNISYSEVAYIGDDDNDYKSMINCGFKACPNDAVDKIKEIVDYISPRKCNESAVGEIIKNKLLK